LNVDFRDVGTVDEKRTTSVFLHINVEDAKPHTRSLNAANEVP